MFFGQLLAKFRSLTAKPSAAKSNSAKRDSSEIQKISQTTLLLPNNNLNSKNKLNKALKNIEKAILHEGSNNQLLLQKADLLLRKRKFHQARQLLNKLSQSRNDSQVSDTAKKLLEAAQKLQQDASTNKTKKLLSDLHAIAKNYNTKLINAPTQESLPTELEITQLVRQEARQARTKGLPKLSEQLIEETLQAGHSSPWLFHDQALSLSMMGKPKKALQLLNELKKTNKGNKLINSINKNLEDIKTNSKLYQSKSKIYFMQQSIAVAKNNSLKTVYLPDSNQVTGNTNCKSLVFKEARASLERNPKACLDLANSILDYFENDLAALQLKGEALAALNQDDKAIQVWNELTHCKNEKINQKASQLITESLIKRAEAISKRKSARTALFFLVEEHLKNNIIPTLHEDIKTLLKQLEPTDTESTYPELQSHQLQLQFNTLVIECLERQKRDQGRLDPSATAQKPGAIRKTAPKAG